MVSDGSAFPFRGSRQDLKVKIGPNCGSRDADLARFGQKLSVHTPKWLL
jgi:hypothetical protein